MACWKPVDLVVSPQKTANLALLMDSAIAELGATEFLPAFRAQAENIRTLLPIGTHKMTIYGIGKLEYKEVKDPRLQLALAIWMQNNLDWIGEVDFFDPVLSQTEVNYLTSIGFHSIGVDEECKRIVENEEPTLFFLPYVPHQLFDNLLHLNKSLEILPRLLFIGNTLETFKNDQDDKKIEEEEEEEDDGNKEDQEDDDDMDSDVDNNFVRFDEASVKNILELLPFAREFPLEVFSDDEFAAFGGLSWQFFRFP